MNNASKLHVSAIVSQILAKVHFFLQIFTEYPVECHTTCDEPDRQRPCPYKVYILEGDKKTINEKINNTASGSFACWWMAVVKSSVFGVQLLGLESQLFPLLMLWIGVQQIQRSWKYSVQSTAKSSKKAREGRGIENKVGSQVTGSPRAIVKIWVSHWAVLSREVRWLDLHF